MIHTHIHLCYLGHTLFRMCETVLRNLWYILGFYPLKVGLALGLWIEYPLFLFNKNTIPLPAGVHLNRFVMKSWMDLKQFDVIDTVNRAGAELVQLWLTAFVSYSRIMHAIPCSSFPSPRPFVKSGSNLGLFWTVVLNSVSGMSSVMPGQKIQSLEFSCKLTILVTIVWYSFRSGPPRKPPAQ